MKPKVIFRADGNGEIGLGHVTRSLGLAEMLRNDFHCIFATRFLTDYIRQEAGRICEEIIHLPESETHFNYFLSVLNGDEIVVLDNYFFDTNYQQAIKDKGCKLVCIDDMHDKHFVADVVINHGGGIREASYSTSPDTCLYVGTKYALLRSPFWSKKDKPDKEDSLFLCLGGADKLNATLEIITLLEQKQFPNPCHVVIGDAFSHQKALMDFQQSSALDIRIHRNLSAQQMVDLMSICRFAICPPSTVSYEFLSTTGELYLKKIADNQEKLYAFFLKTDIAFDLSELFVEDKRRLEASRLMQKKCFDGKSPNRIIKLFNQLSQEFCLKLKPATLADRDLYFGWANDPDSRANALNPKEITYEEHITWFSNKLSSKNAYLWVLEENGISIGQIRFDLAIVGKEAVISYFIDPSHRGKGLGLSILRLGIEQFIKQKTNTKTVIGFVKESNEASCKVFQRLNFQQNMDEDPKYKGFLEYKKEIMQ